MLCPAAEDAALCEEYVRGYWSEITAAMYPKFLDPKDWCPGTEDVETCKQGVADLIPSAMPILG